MATTPEGKIQLEIMRYLRKRGYLFWRFSPETFNAQLGFHIKHEYIPSGLPDIHILHPGDTKAFPYPVFIGLEVKTNRNSQSPDQKLMERRFGLANAEYFVVRSIEDVKTLGL